MHRAVRIEVKNINVGTGLLISLDDDKNQDVILTVCHVFGEDKGGYWERWDITSDDVQVTSDYYTSLEFEVTNVLYKEGDANEKDFALIYIKKLDGIDEPNPYVPEDDKMFLNCHVLLDGYGREEENGTLRVINGVLHDFINDEHKLYRVNYTENDRVGTLPSVEVNKGMSGGPVYLYKNGTYFMGMQKMVPSPKSTDGILGVFTYKYCLEQIKCLYEIELPLKRRTKSLINNDSLFRHIHVIKQKFDILPESNEHIGASIEYQDFSELRDGFLNELIYTMIDWVYCSEKYEELKQKIINNGKTEAAACSEMQRKVYKQFRRDENGQLLFAQGQIGELLLFHFIQKYLGAVPLLRKEQIVKNPNDDSICVDAIHYKNENDKNIIILGEAKSFTSVYNFNDAFTEAIESILYAYSRHREELALYIHEDFLDKEMDLVAESYLNNTMKKIEVRLVAIVIYNETQKLSITNEDDIKSQIDSIINDRYNQFDNKNIPMEGNPILNRITYILFPIWKIEELAKDFQELL